MAQILNGGFPVIALSCIAEITRYNTFTKEINLARARSQYFNENLFCKNCLLVFSAMTGKPALLQGMIYFHDKFWNH